MMEWQVNQLSKECANEHVPNLSQSLPAHTSSLAASELCITKEYAAKAPSMCKCPRQRRTNGQDTDHKDKPRSLARCPNCGGSRPYGPSCLVVPGAAVLTGVKITKLEPLDRWLLSCRTGRDLGGILANN